MIKQLILVMFIVSLSATAFASTQAPSVRTSQGDSYIICDNETDSGAVCDNGTDDFVVFVHGYNNLTFFFRESGAAATCQAYAVGHYADNGDAINVLTTAVLSTLSTDPLFSTPLSATQTAITLTNPDFNAVFVVCTGAGMNVMVELRGSTKAPLR